MKYIVLLGDGMADRPLAELGGRTPLQAAFTPNMDRLASEGLCGMARTVPGDYEPGSDVANMSILGYDPALYYTGRAPLEAASMGVELKPDDVAYRCNLVTLRRDGRIAFMEDYSAGHITSEEAAKLIREVAAGLRARDAVFYPGVSYRHLMVWRGGEDMVVCTPPHDILGKNISEFMPLGPGAEFLVDLMKRSVGILEKHSVNDARVSEGRNPANSIWLWGQGKKPMLQPFKDVYGVTGAMVSAVDLMNGLAVCAGLEVLKVPGVTGWLDTNYMGKAEYAMDALKRHDFAYIHVEAPDEAGHMGKIFEKVKAIEDFDAQVVGTVLSAIRRIGPCRILLMPDHSTPIAIRTHSKEAVPFVIWDSTAPVSGRMTTYDERIGRAPGAITVDKGHTLMERLIKGT